VTVRAAYVGAAFVVAAAMLSAAAAAGTVATKQRIAIDLEFYPDRTFHFVPRESGPLDGDSGRVARIPESSGRSTMRDGQRVTVHEVTWPLRGKRGTLRVRERTEWVDLGSDVNRDGHQDAVAFGTWKVVGGTGQYAKLTGGGRSAHAGLGDDWNARYDGILTSP
jgi:hypothetical protein